MPIVVNKNPTATVASFNLSRANDMLRHSLAKLSSGKRIINASDDAGGLAVAYKMESALKRTEAVRINVQNGLSFLQVQDGGLKVIGKILDRMSELRTYSDDITKSTSDTENYSKEFVELQQQLLQISREKFNGISLFTNNAGGGTDYDGDGVNEMALTLLTTASGVAADGYVSVTQVNLQDILTVTDGTGTTYNLGNLDSGNVSIGGGGNPFKAGVLPTHVEVELAVLDRNLLKKVQAGMEQELEGLQPYEKRYARLEEIRDNLDRVYFFKQLVKIKRRGSL